MILPIIGLLFLVFRIWICEYKLKVELDFRRYYFSRILAIFYAITLIYNLQNMTFNFICCWSIPFTTFAIFGWDVKFFKSWFLDKVPEWRGKRGWMIIERLTLHFPIFFCSIYWCISNFETFIFGLISNARSMEPIISITYAWVLLILSFCLLDVRFSEKHGWPVGRTLILIGNGLVIILIFIIYFAI